MKNSFKILFSLLLIAGLGLQSINAATKKERDLIISGNKAYEGEKFAEARSFYEEALKENPASAEARYNLGLAKLKLYNPGDTTRTNRNLIEDARSAFSDISGMYKTKPQLAKNASYNLGNLSMAEKNYAEAIDYYKQALRLNPDDEKARRNLRIAQLNLKKNESNKNKNNNDNDNKEDNKKDKDKEKDKDKNKENNSQNNKDQKNQDNRQQNNQQGGISKQAAAQILKASENKENQTRARVNAARESDKEFKNNINSRRW